MEVIQFKCCIILLLSSCDPSGLDSDYMARADKDKDGLLTFDEFKAAIASFGNIPAASRAMPPPPTVPPPPSPPRSVPPSTPPQQQTPMPPPNTISVRPEDAELLKQMHDYLTENEAVLQNYFQQADGDGNGESSNSDCFCLLYSLNNEH